MLLQRADGAPEAAIIHLPIQPGNGHAAAIAREPIDKMSAHVLCYTSCTYTYLGRARVLFESIRRYHPKWTLVALLTDRLPDGGQIVIDDECFNELLVAQELDIKNFDGWLFSHDIVEACTAVKGPFLLRALEEGLHDVIIYLDPDTCLFGSLDPVLEALQHDAIVLTPHQLAPATSRMLVRDDEIGSLRYGIYNLGFLAVSRTDRGLRFARWWNERLLEHCFDDADLGLFVDQRWCDHVPVFFEGVKILKDPGYNVASWNVSQRRISFDKNGALCAAGHQIRFCHFTKVGSVGDLMLRKNALYNFEALEVWRWYNREIERLAFKGVPSGWWAYATFEDGEKITAKHRKLYRTRSDLMASFLLPFSSGPGTYQAWLHAQDDA